MFKSRLNVAIGVVILAVLLHMYLTKQYYGLKFGQAEASICNVNALFNCDTASASKYSNIMGIPMALLGALMNTFLLALLVFQRLRFVQDMGRLSRLTTWLSFFIAGVSVVMASFSMFALGTWCLFCVAAYVLSFVAAYCVFTSKEGGLLQNLPEDAKSLVGEFKSTLVGFLFVPVLAYVVNDMAFENSPLKDIDRVARDEVTKWSQAPEQKFDFSTGLVKKAKNQPPRMIIVEFADFRCPHCKHAAPTLHSFAAAHPDVEFIFKSYPLDGTCNQAMQGGGDGISCELAFLTFCAEKTAQKGWEAHDFVFSKQEEVIRMSRLDDFRNDLYSKVGLNSEEMEKCRKSEEIFKLVQTMAQEGENAKLTGTPSVYVNNRYLQGAHFMPILESAYRAISK